ncbi:MAG: TlpA family protein disulfide reductase [Anaerolineae bacterium]|nr:TlpA family protein disulfide reductase [Anaerolineae bacterium]
MQKIMVLMVILGMVMAACAPAAPTSEATLASQDVMATPTPESAEPPPTSAVESSSAAVEGEGYMGAAWTSIELVDARTGETFRFADFAGKTVFVEPMATWCTNCRRQLPNVEAARTQLDPEQYVFVGLSVAENVDNATLAQYVNEQGWNFAFVAAPETLTQGLVDSFGRTVVTPPSTPHFIIRPDGSLSEIRTGSHSTEELIAELQAASGV